MSRSLIWFRVIYFEVQRDMGESSGRVGRRKKTSRGSWVVCWVVCILSEVGHQLVNKAQGSSITRQIGRCGKTSREREQMLACTPPPPPKQHNNIQGAAHDSTARVGEISVVVDCCVRRSLLFCLFTIDITPPEQSTTTSLHTTHTAPSSRVVAGHTPASQQAHKQKHTTLTASYHTSAHGSTLA